MTEQVTYRGHSRPFTFEFDGKGVAKAVSVNSFLDLGAREPGQQMANIALVDVPTLQRAEGGGTAVHPPRQSYLEPAGQECRSSDIDAHNSAFVTLAVLARS